MVTLDLPDNLLLHQLALSEIQSQRMEEKPISYRRGKTTKQAAQIRMLCAQLSIDDEYRLLDLLLQAAFEKYFERSIINGE